MDEPLYLAIDLLSQMKSCIRHQSEPIHMNWCYSEAVGIEHITEEMALEALDMAIEVLTAST